MAIHNFQSKETLAVDTDRLRLRVNSQHRFHARIALIVPTKNRPAELKRLLTSVQSQDALPDEIIIVDASTEPVEWVLKDFPELNLRYERMLPPCVSKQRNAGMAQISPHITVVGYLDDDLVLEPGSLEGMLRFWDNAPDHIGGAAFNITNVWMPRALLIKTIFGIDSFRRGAIMRSGYQAMIGPIRKDTYVDWLSGGATVWRRQVVEEFKFDEWFLGYGYLEDIEYSYRVGQKYRLIVLAGAPVKHLSPPVRKRRNYLMGKCQVINRRYFIRKHRHLSVALFYWATMGLIIANMAEGVFLWNFGFFARAWGNIVGLLQSSFGPLEQIDRSLKD